MSKGTMGTGGRLKVAPYSFTIARTLRMKAQVMRTLEGKRQCFSIFYYLNMSTKAKLTLNFLAFPLVKFRETWQTGSKCFALVGASFSGKSIRPVFSQR